MQTHESQEIKQQNWAQSFGYKISRKNPQEQHDLYT